MMNLSTRTIGSTSACAVILAATALVWQPRVVAALDGTAGAAPTPTPTPSDLQKCVESVQSSVAQAIKDCKLSETRSTDKPTCVAECECECEKDSTEITQRTLSKVSPAELPKCVECLARLAKQQRQGWKSLTAEATATPETKKASPDQEKKTTKKSREDLQKEALDLYRAYHAVKDQAKQVENKEPPEKARLVKRDLRGLRDEVNALLSDAGLRQPIMAQLVTGFLTGAASAQNLPAGNGGTLPEGYLEFASRRGKLIGIPNTDGEKRLDVNVAGRFGFVPALCLLSSTPTAAATSSADASTSNTAPTARLQQAFIWEGGVNVNLRASPTLEFSLIAQGGQTKADDHSSIQGTKDDAVLVVPLSGSDFRWRWSAGVRARVYAANQTPACVQELNGLVAPALEATLLFRRDARFEEQNGTIVPESGWPRRLAFRLMLNSIPVIKAGSLPGTPPAFAISFGVEYEGRWPGTHDRLNVPPVTRLIVRGSTDLLNILKGHN
jgi:hypothetical protein